MNATKRTIVWFRGKDLRIADHAPLRFAAARGEVIPLFVVDPYFFAPERAEKLPNRMQFLIDSLDSLRRNIAAKGSELVLVAGKSTEVVPKLAQQWSVDKVVAHRWTEPFARERDRRIGEALGERFVLFEGETIAPPESIRSKKGTPFAVFSPFGKTLRKTFSIERPIPPPKELPPLPSLPPFERAELPTVESLGLSRNENVVSGGERAARDRLQRFLKNYAADYPDLRNRMDLDGTSRLSADLKFGTLSVREAWWASFDALGDGDAWFTFSNELLWREFAYQSLWDRPTLLREPFRANFQGFPWRELDCDENRALWEAWCTGHTGYPIVDAAARQLLREGFVHNRARMISASFLTKHLRIHYRHGEAHYMKHLVDGDWASNNMGWQWSAGCGCDAQPYFRVFNPMSQGAKFDPEGDYVRKYVPELKDLPKKHIHAPFDAPELFLLEAGVTLGKTYPRPVVDHKTAREAFLSTAKSYLKRDS